MKNTIGNNVTLTLFGESHGKMIGCVLDGIPSGIPIDEEFIAFQMDKRKAVGTISTQRHEEDKVEIVSGVFNGFTTGTPICLQIQNKDMHSKDYSATKDLARPSHADYTAELKYNGFQDYRGGGHFSGRLTAPLVAAGAICIKMLESKGILLGSHIESLYTVQDDSFSENLPEEIIALNKKSFACINEDKAKQMIEKIEEARNQEDSLGGILETVVINLTPGVGEPTFDSLESTLSHALFSIGAVKGVSFGEGFGFAKLKGSEANDAFEEVEGKIITKSNKNGGINGGISNGMPLVIHTVVKPTPSISQTQDTVNFKTKENTTIEIKGRHDPAIIHRARVVVDSMVAFTLVDALITRFGELYFGEKV